MFHPLLPSYHLTNIPWAGHLYVQSDSHRECSKTGAEVIGLGRSVTDDGSTEIYLFHVWLRQISPMIWRRLLLRSDSTPAHTPRR